MGEAFSSSPPLACVVRIVYCHACGTVSTNTIGENDVCTRCGAKAERMPYRRPWQYYASSAILLVAAAVFLWGPFNELSTRALIFVGVLVVAVALSNWGMSETRRKVLEEVAKRKAAEEKA